MRDFLFLIVWAWARFWDERAGRIAPDPPTAPQSARRGIAPASAGLKRKTVDHREQKGGETSS